MVRRMYRFVETRVFTKHVVTLLSDAAYGALQAALITDPLAGDLIKDSGGLRKIRWSGSGRGKSGGVRVIYYPRPHLDVIWMITIYAKNVADAIPAKVRREIAKELADDKG